MKEELENILKEAHQLEFEIKTLQDLENFRIKFLGRSGLLNNFIEKFKDLPKEEKAKIGEYFNYVKNEIRKIYDELKIKLEKPKKIKFDIAHPGERIEIGYLNILKESLKKIRETFLKLGFDIEKGREIVNEYENFDSLNMPKFHPARDMFDTLWIKNKIDKNRYLLRTHTSAHQIEIIKSKKLPIRVAIPGKVFRHEALDVRHEFQFHQVEILGIDEGANLEELKGVLETVFSEFFNKKLRVSFKSSYFPFTEPSLEVYIECVICNGKGCSLCKKSGLLEVGGAGMVHPNVLKEGGLDPKKYYGYAAGIGVERLIMLKYKVDDIRLFNSQDLRFINQFKL
ncbi:MAG: phenylalanine--tRNA ligase subunit alpha [Minisyncoccia bacterium]